MSADTRYQELLAGVPAGYYTALGSVLPYRSGQTTLAIPTAWLNQRVAISVNGVVQTICTTSAQGLATFAVQLPLGDVELLLQRQNSVDTIKKYFTTRQYAVWLSALATQLDSVDSNADAALQAFYLHQAKGQDLDLAHGVMLLTPNEMQADQDTYRECLQMMRQTMRYFNGTLSGKRASVAAITQVNPYILRRDQGTPRWVLGYNPINDGDLQAITRTVREDPLPGGAFSNNLNLRGPFVNLLGVDKYVNLGYGGLSYSYYFKRMLWTVPSNSSYVRYPIAPLWVERPICTSGDVSIPTGRVPAQLTSLHLPLGTSSGHLYLSLDGLGVADVRFELGGTLDLATKINAALQSDARYGVKRTCTQPAGMGEIVEIFNVSDGMATGTAVIDQPSGGYFGFTAPGDSVGRYVQAQPGQRVRLVSGNGKDYIDVLAAERTIDLPTTDTFTILSKYANAAVMVNSNDQVQITSQNKHLIDGPSEVIIHDGGESIGTWGTANSATHPYRGMFDTPKISATLTSNVNPGATTIQVSSYTAYRFSNSKGNLVTPFQALVGYGLRAGTGSSYNLVAEGDGSTALVTFTGDTISRYDTHIVFYTFQLQFNTQCNMGAHPILNWISSNQVRIAYAGPGTTQTTAFTSSVSIIAVDPRMAQGYGILNFAAPNMRWREPNSAVYGPNVSVTTTGRYRIYGNEGHWIDILVYVVPVVAASSNIRIAKFVSYVGGYTLYSVWSSGEPVTVTSVDTATYDTWHLQSPIVGKYRFGAQTQLVYSSISQLPLRAVSQDDYGSLSVRVNMAYEPTQDMVGPILIEGSSLPDGWVPSSTYGTPWISPDSRFNKSCVYFDQANVAQTVGMEKLVPMRLVKPGRSYTLRVWARNEALTDDLSQQLEIGFDFGSGAVTKKDTGTVLSEPDASIRQPQHMSFSAVMPPTATQFKIIVRRPNNAYGVHNFVIERVLVTQDNSYGLFTGHGTIPRSTGRSTFGSLLYAFCPDQLSTDEKNLLGIAAPATPGGRIRDSFNAFEQVDAFDGNNVVGGSVVNVRGVVKTSQFNACALTNMQVVARSPDRFSYAKPSLVSDVTGVALQFSLNSGYYYATLAVTSDQNQATTVLYEDGIPLTNDKWSYHSATQVKVAAGNFNASAKYTIDYQALIRIETPAIDTTTPDPNGVDLWLADYVAWNRQRSEVLTVQQTVPLTFDTTYRAKLPRMSDGQKYHSSLLEDTGIQQRTIPISAWDFEDTRTVRIDGGEFNADAIYSLTYNAQITDPARVVSVKAELRKSASVLGLAGATYAPIQIDDVMDTAYGTAGYTPYCQIRLTLSNVANVDDIRVHSITLRGLNLSGTGSPPPGM